MAKDFVVDFDNESLFANGDIKTGDSDKQNQYLLLICQKGSFKQFPATCVGASNYLEAESPDSLINEVRRQFTSDGMKVNAIKIEDGKLKIDANY